MSEFNVNNEETASNTGTKKSVRQPGHNVRDEVRLFTPEKEKVRTGQPGHKKRHRTKTPEKDKDIIVAEGVPNYGSTLTGCLSSINTEEFVATPGMHQVDTEKFEKTPNDGKNKMSETSVSSKESGSNKTVRQPGHNEKEWVYDPEKYKIKMGQLVNYEGHRVFTPERDKDINVAEGGPQGMPHADTEIRGTTPNDMQRKRSWSSSEHRAEGPHLFKKRSLPHRLSEDDLGGEQKELAATWVNWCLGSMIVTVLLVVFILTPISSIIIGGIHVGKCKVEPRLPVWLIVFGFIFFIFLLVCIGIQVYARRRQQKLVVNNCAEGRTPFEGELYENEYKTSLGALVLFVFFAVFLFTWFVVGNVLLFKHWAVVRESSENCNPVLFYVSLAAIINCYIFFISLSCLVCFSTCTFYCMGV